METFNCTVLDKRGYKGYCMEECFKGQGMFVEKKELEKEIKKQELAKKGTTKLLNSLNSGRSVYVSEYTAVWLEDCGFQVEYLTLPPYEGNLPVEDRIAPVYIKLKRGNNEN